MAITLEQVKVWLIEEGVGHIVMSRQDHWKYCACRLTTGGRITKKRPKRLCRKCRELMDKMNVVKG